MPAGISKAKGRQNSKTRARGGRDKLGLPAKAEKRKPLASKFGKHITSEETRDRNMRLNALGVAPYERPVQWRQPGEVA